MFVAFAYGAFTPFIVNAALLYARRIFGERKIQHTCRIVMRVCTKKERVGLKLLSGRFAYAREYLLYIIHT